MLPRMLKATGLSITSVLSKAFKKIVAGTLSNILASTSMLHLQSSHRKSLETCDALLTLSHCLQVALDRGMERSLVQLDSPAAFDRVSHSGLLYMLKFIGVAGQFFSKVSEFLSDRTQRV